MDKSIRVKVPIPNSDLPHRIEVWYKDELNRHGGVAAGITETTVKLPAPLEDCTVQIIPCDDTGNPVGRGYTYQKDKLTPAQPKDMDPPTESSDEEDCCGEPESCESIEITPESSTSVEIERPESDDLVDEDPVEDEEEDNYIKEENYN